MNSTLSRTVLAVSLLGMSATAFAAKPCDELKSELDAKLQAKGVQSFSLEILANGADNGGKSIGTCDGGTKFISYKRGVAVAAATPAAAPAVAPVAAPATPASAPAAK